MKLILKFSNVSARMMRIARVAPELVIYDVPGNQKSFEIRTGSMTKDLTTFVVQTNCAGTGSTGSEIPLFHLEADYDGSLTERLEIKVKTTDREGDLGQIDPDVLRAMQALQVHLNGEQIQQSLASG